MAIRTLHSPARTRCDDSSRRLDASRITMAMALRMNTKHRNPFGYSGIACIEVTTLQTWLHSTGSEEAEGSAVHTWAGILV
jgi:hypothetical protein